MGLISVLVREGQTLDEYWKHFHIYTLNFWRHFMWVDNGQLFVLQGTINPGKLKGGPSHKSPIIQLAFHFLREINLTQLILQWSCRMWYQATSIDGGRCSWPKNEYPPSCNFWIQVSRWHLLWMRLRTIAISPLNAQNSPRWAWIRR